MITFALVFLKHLLLQAGAAVPFISAAFPVTLFLVIPISYKLPSFLFLDPSLPTLYFAQGKSKYINKSYSQTLSSFLSLHCSVLHQSPCVVEWELEPSHQHRREHRAGRGT